MTTNDLYPASLKGRRIRLISTNDPYTRLQPGATGTIFHEDDWGTVHVTWDNGSTLGLVLGDMWELVKAEGTGGYATPAKRRGWYEINLSKLAAAIGDVSVDELTEAYLAPGTTVSRWGTVCVPAAEFNTIEEMLF